MKHTTGRRVPRPEERWTAKRLKAFRAQRRETQQDLAVALRVSISTVAKWEASLSKPSRLAAMALDELERREARARA